MEALKAKDVRHPAVEVLLIEGGKWLPWKLLQFKLVRAIRFEDGSIWDSVSGWGKE